eukprot:CAMPEP_0202860068 /NCGR_PEP_ID=MMETSP1391-20130828/1933_1 /ASSEMBLY_ACC=CAM_ASM_000867 /TAXON_ID=1034604 /ORGANISM="Chlamydomonas leiostraca, Strain SAG 11-49" /LENGTH=521 /DNA_ID=CAMNT_0049539199 /DNA_START=181 /DNA_END=1746 /DNA_ORIENTATION=-
MAPPAPAEEARPKLQELGLVHGPVAMHDSSAYLEKVELHRGRHSTVWSAKHCRSGELVVLKAYECSKLRHRQIQNVFREIRLLRRLNGEGHGGIVELLAAWEQDEYIFLAFAPCLRGDVYQLFVKEKERGLSEHYVSSQVVMPLLSTLNLLHGMEIVHRDIKPENLFITLEGELQVGDFGLAADKSVDKLTERVGTLDYMAPEVLAMPTPDEMQAGRGRNLRPYDEKVDVWAVGVLCYELLVGCPPYEVEDPKETAKLILAAKPPPFPTHLSDGCVDFIRRALARKAAQRPAADDMLKHPWVVRHSQPPCPVPTPGPLTPDLPRAKAPNWSASEHVSPSTSRGSQSLDPVPSDDSTRVEDAQHAAAPAGPAGLRSDVRAIVQPSGGGGGAAGARKEAGVALPPLLGASGATRRASSGTSEYYGYATPTAKPSSPEQPSRSASLTGPTGLGAPPLAAGEGGLAKSASACCLQSGADAGACGSAQHTDSSDATAIAWQSLQIAGMSTGAACAKKPVGKSRFAR